MVPPAHSTTSAAVEPPLPADLRRRRSAARLAAVQALYQHDMSPTPIARLLNEFHAHRLGEVVDGDRMVDADIDFFDDIVSGALARREELDAHVAGLLQSGWSLGRLDRLMLQILRCGAYELVARADVPAGAVVSEYVDVANAFYPKAETGFVNALLDRLGKSVRAAG